MLWSLSPFSFGARGRFFRRRLVAGRGFVAALDLGRAWRRLGRRAAAFRHLRCLLRSRRVSRDLREGGAGHHTGADRHQQPGQLPRRRRAHGGAKPLGADDADRLLPLDPFAGVLLPGDDDRLGRLRPKLGQRDLDSSIRLRLLSLRDP